MSINNKTDNKSYRNSEITSVHIIAILAAFVCIFIALFIYLRIRKKRKLNEKIDKKVPKTFSTSFAIEKRYEIIHYYCSALHALLDLNEEYKNYTHYLLSGSAFAYRSVLKKRFTDIFEYLVEVLKLDYKHYCGVDLQRDNISLMKSTLQSSFVARYYRFRTYDALDSFSKYSDFLVDILRQINLQCQASDNNETESCVDRMHDNIHNYYCKYREYVGIREKVYKKHEWNYYGVYILFTTYYYTFGHERSHFITLLRHYIEFIDSYCKNMQEFYDMDGMLKN